MTTATDQPPHSYREQRLAEKTAAKARHDQLRAGVKKIPPICGYTYLSHKSKRYPDRPREIVACMRGAGASTKHHGTGYCNYHDWLATKEGNKGGKQLNDAIKHAKDRAFFFGTPIDIDPHTALIQEISRTASIVAWLNDQLQELRDQGMTNKDIMMQNTLQAGFRPSVWMELFQQERDHLIKTCVAAIKAGVAERKVRIAEQQGQLIATMMFAFVHDMELGLSPDQIIAAPKLIRKHLMALPMAPNAETTIDPAGVMRSTQAFGKDIIDVQSR